jgi:hypothetical protein
MVDVGMSNDIILHTGGHSPVRFVRECSKVHEDETKSLMEERLIFA